MLLLFEVNGGQGYFDALEWFVLRLSLGHGHGAEVLRSALFWN
jgi:hypothetical protein